MRLRIPGITVLLALGLLAGSPAWSAWTESLARDGVADLTGWEIGTYPVVNLSGTWDWFPHEFLVSQGIPGPHLPLHHEKVPDNLSSESTLAGSKGSGTLRLRVLLPQSLQQPNFLGIRLPVITSASRVWWNDVLIAEGGSPRPIQIGNKPGWNPGLHSLSDLQNVNFLTIELSNYDDVYIGVMDHIQLGRLEDLNTARDADFSADLLIFGILLVMGLYHIGFWIHRRKDFSLIFFGLTCMLISVRPFVYGRMLLRILLPAVPWEFTMTMGYLTMCLPVLTFSLFMVHLLDPAAFGPPMIRKWFLRTVVAVSGIYALTVVLTPPAFYTGFLSAFQTFAAVTGVFILGVLIRGVVGGQMEARYLLAGFCIFFLTVLNDIISVATVLDTPQLSNGGLVAFLVFQSLIIIRRYSHSILKVEEANTSLSAANQNLQRFVPRELLELLGKESLDQVAPGDSVLLPLTVLHIGLQDPHQKMETEFLNSCLGTMGQVVRAHGGFVKHYQPDGLVAMFPQTPDDALAAALDLHGKLPYLHGSSRSHTDLRLYMGIHCASTLLATVGETTRMDSTLLSTTAMVAAWLKGRAFEEDLEILASAHTIGRLDQPGAFHTVPLGPLVLPGTIEGSYVYRVLPDGGMP